MKDHIKITRKGTFYYLDNREVTRAEFLKRYPPPTQEGDPALGNRPWTKPILSDALAVHPDQIEEALERNKRHGLTSVQYNPEDGRAIIPDRAARRELLKIEKAHDNEGGYGDG